MKIMTSYFLFLQRLLTSSIKFFEEGSTNLANKTHPDPIISLVRNPTFIPLGLIIKNLSGPLFLSHSFTKRFEATSENSSEEKKSGLCLA